ncbi:MAG: flavohemoglobin expression-modulating QEGLA motif protein [Pseudomonadales bacterium]
MKALDPTFRALDDALVGAVSGIHLLRHLSWPVEIQQAFLSDWRRGRKSLPVVEYARLDLTDTRRELDRIVVACTGLSHPLGEYLSDTAASYGQICQLMEQAGTAAAGDISVAVYGRPGSLLPGSQQTNLEAATYFLDVGREYFLASRLSEPSAVLPSEEVARQLRARIGAVITDDVIQVLIDPHLASKAAAGATRIRLRAGTGFAEDDLEQLLQHEAFIHSLTALNGRRQPNLRSLSLGAPRTTPAQEGLATFAELVTGAIDIARMERIALRVNAIHLARSGASFLELFEFFLNAGQPEVESFHSTMRVFRGVPPSGGSAFTKDVVYLTGMLEVHTFFRWALENQQLETCRLLFAGRMMLKDVFRLGPAFADGILAAPRYLPPWMTRTNGLTAYLAFSVFANHIAVADVHSDAFNI